MQRYYFFMEKTKKMQISLQNYFIYEKKLVTLHPIYTT